MNMHVTDLRHQLLSRLRRFAAKRGTVGEQRIAQQMFSYCSLSRERFVSLVLPTPSLGVVLEGVKEVWLGDECQSLAPGTVFAFPRGVPLDVVNLPDERSGIYESLCMTIPELPPGIAPLPGPRVIDSFSVTLTEDLVQSICHAATILSDPALKSGVAAVRLTELLMLLSTDPVGRMVMAGTLTERARWTLASQPGDDWTVAALAQRLGVGASTLRRHLDAEATPFRQLLAQARMKAAQDTIDRGGRVADAMAVAGYSSRSHFTRAYRRAFDTTPGGRVAGTGAL